MIIGYRIGGTEVLAGIGTLTQAILTAMILIGDLAMVTVMILIGDLAMVIGMIVIRD